MENSISKINFTENKSLRELLAYMKRCVMFEECQRTQRMVGGSCSLLDMLLPVEILAECHSEEFERVDPFNFTVLVHNFVCVGGIKMSNFVHLTRCKENSILSSVFICVIFFEENIIFLF